MWVILICSSSGSIPKGPNSAVHINFEPHLVQVTQYATQYVVAYFPYAQIIPSMNKFLMDLDLDFYYWSHKSGWFVTPFISHKIHRAVFVNFDSINLL